MKQDELQSLAARLRDFAAARDWDQFHTPKNLAMALIAEAGELVEHFQWLTPEESIDLPERVHGLVELELADIMLYLARIADILGVDILDAARRKMEINEEKYPADKVRGRALKYTDL